MAKKKSRTAGSTPAIVALEAAGIPFEVLEYDHDPRSTLNFGMEAATALGRDPASVFKTLMVMADSSLSVGIVPVGGHLDLKALAQALGAKRAVMADQALAQRATGYVVGGISPLGQKTRHATVLDASALTHATVLVSGGRRGLDIELAPQDLAQLTAAVVAPIARA
ncbi:Cys-tRNA(Pro) deacylase [Rarobacter incanus]|nr:Cys-tRNA(Pro) deacylase [Rarobacter incanus]